MKVQTNRRSVHEDPSLARRGSVLVPIVAAMLILLLAGVALAELFGAQQVQSVSASSSAQAYWIAEAGLWHVVHDGASLPAAVSFGGGSYIASRSGNDYTSTGTLNGAVRVVSKTVLTDPGGPTSTSPIDEAASVAGAEPKGDKKVKLPLVSIVTEDLVIESFSLSADVPTEPLHRAKLDGKELYHEHYGPLPTEVVSVTDVKVEDRTIEGLDRPDFEFELADDMEAFVTFTLVLNFTNGTSSTLTFGVEFDG